jgi:hypothetical protein
VIAAAMLRVSTPRPVANTAHTAPTATAPPTAAQSCMLPTDVAVPVASAVTAAVTTAVTTATTTTAAPVPAAVMVFAASAAPR